jgi:hypothetical protein
LPPSIRGRALFESGFGVNDVNERQKQGWVFRKTTLSDEFGFEDAQDKLPEAAHMLLILRKSGTMRFFTHVVRPEPRPGDKIITYSPPRAKTPQEAAEKRKGRDGPKAQPA